MNHSLDLLCPPTALPGAGLLHQCEQGRDCASEDGHQAIPTAHGTTCGMSRQGDCYDIAVMGSVFSALKRERGEWFDTCGEDEMELFGCSEVFQDQRRRHSTPGQISPAELERRARMSQAA